MGAYYIISPASSCDIMIEYPPMFALSRKLFRPNAHGWVTPFLALECDTHEKPGALYGEAGLMREWKLCDILTLVTYGGTGFGNPHHNDWCFERDRWTFREMHLGAELEIDVCPHVKLVPRIDFYDYFTEAQRRTYDKFNGFIAITI